MRKILFLGILLSLFCGVSLFSQELTYDKVVRDYYFELQGKGKMNVIRVTSAKIPTMETEEEEKWLSRYLKEDALTGQIKNPRFGRSSISYTIEDPYLINCALNGNIVNIYPSIILFSLPEELLKTGDEPLAPLTLDQPIDIEWIHRIHIPKNFIVKEMPESARWMIGPLELKQSIYREDQLLIVKYQLLLADTTLTPGDRSYLTENALGFAEHGKPLQIEVIPYAQTLWEKGDYKGAFEYYEKTGDYLRYANKALDLRMVIEARQMLEKAILLTPNEPLVWYYWGLSHYSDKGGQRNTNKEELAIADNAFQKVKELGGDTVEFWSKMTEIHLYSPEKNIEPLKALLPYENEQFASRFLLAKAYFQSGEIEALKAHLAESGNFPWREVYDGLLINVDQGSEAMASFFKGKIEDENFSNLIYLAMQDLLVVRDYDTVRALVPLLQEKLGIEDETVKNLAQNSKNLVKHETLDLMPNSIDNLVHQFFINLYYSDGSDFSALASIMTPKLFESTLNRESIIHLYSLHDIFVAGRSQKGENKLAILDELLQGQEVAMTELDDGYSSVEIDLNEAGFSGIFKMLVGTEEMKLIAFLGQDAGIGEYLQAHPPTTLEVFKWLAENHYYPGTSCVTSWNKEYEEGRATIDELIKAWMIETGSAEKALPYFEEKYKVNPTQIVEESLLVIYEALESVKMIPILEKRVEADKSNIDLLSRLLYAYAFFNEVDKAELIREEILLLTDDVKVLDAIYYQYYAITRDRDAYEAWVQKLAETNEAKDFHYNFLAWLAVIENRKPTDREYMYARKAVELSQSQSDAIIHTQACLFALDGRFEAAVDLLTQLEAKSLEGGFKNQDWMLHGLIADGLGFVKTRDFSFSRITPEGNYTNYSLSCEFFRNVHF